jgi:hypothetical protein
MTCDLLDRANSFFLFIPPASRYGRESDLLDDHRDLWSQLLYEKTQRQNKVSGVLR